MDEANFATSQCNKFRCSGNQVTRKFFESPDKMPSVIALHSCSVLNICRHPAIRIVQPLGYTMCLGLSKNLKVVIT